MVRSPPHESSGLNAIVESFIDGKLGEPWADEEAVEDDSLHVDELDEVLCLRARRSMMAPFGP